MTKLRKLRCWFTVNGYDLLIGQIYWIIGLLGYWIIYERGVAQLASAVRQTRRIVCPVKFGT